MAEPKAARPIEEYGFIGNTQTAALIARDGTLEWLCLPRFDGPACFASLLGGPENGQWVLAPAQPARRITRRYLDGTAVLETRFEAEGGCVVLTDCLALPETWEQVDLIRTVRCEAGEVAMHLCLILRFDYGHLVPWVRHRRYGIHAVAGPNAVQLRSPVALVGKGMTTQADFTLRQGEEAQFLFTAYPSHHPSIRFREPEFMLEQTVTWWRTWSQRCRPVAPWEEPVRRSVITLKALTYGPTGGIVAAPTTSLPERLGGVRNWDYRFCWIRDATFTLLALLGAGYTEEAAAWREWLLRSAAGEPSRLQIMYGLAGERRLPEAELPWLAGYGGSRPVRIGNAAHDQLQLDVFGEMMDALHVSRRHGLETNLDAWNLQTALMEFVEHNWEREDEGLWEVRGPRRDFTHSKVMAWVAVDRCIKSAGQFNLKGDLGKWRKLRSRIHEDVCRQGFSTAKNSFVQFYGGEELDASLLLIPQVGFLPADDPRVLGTIAAVERELRYDGLVLRYRHGNRADPLPPGEGAFLACSFWLADALAMTGRHGEAREMFEELIGLRNDLGLLSEEVDPRTRAFLGNFPQAFSHVGLIDTALNLSQETPAPAEERPAKEGE